MKNDFSKGMCFSQQKADAKDLQGVNQGYCSSYMNKATLQIRQELRMFSCPFKSYCGSADLETIVPTFDGEKRRFIKNAGTVSKLGHFSEKSACRHRIRFPMDASEGDKVELKVNYLKNV